MSGIDEVFTSILFGSGNLFGLILFATLLIGLTLAWKYTAVLTVPFSIILALEYLTNGLGWNALLMLLLMTFMIFQVIMRKGR